MNAIKQFLQPLLARDDFSVLPLAGDASSRRYYRIVTDEKTSVLMQWDPFTNPEDFPFLSVQQYFAQNDIRVPKIYHYDAKAGLFLLEDLGDLTLERVFWEFQNQENILPYYRSSIDELIKIHRLNFEKKPDDHCTAYNIEFSVEKLMWEFNYMYDHLIKKMLKVAVTPSQDVALKNCFERICTELYELPQVICHRDFHSRNIMIKHGRHCIIDFQDARLGPAVYDLVSLLLDSYVDLSEQTIESLLNYYAEKFPHFAKIATNRESFRKDFDRQSIQRCLKACGSFSSFYNTRGDERYLKYINPTLTLVLTQLEKFPEYNIIKDLLEDTKDQWSAL